MTPGFSADETDWCIPALLNLVRELARGHDVHVFALRYPHSAGTYTVHGATVHALGGAEVDGLGRVPLLMRALVMVVKEGRWGHFDVVHGLWADEPGFLAVMTGRLLRVPVVVSLLGGELEYMPALRYGHQLSHAARWLIAVALHRADRVTVGSSYLYHRALTRLPTKRLIQIPLGVDISHFHPGPVHHLVMQEGKPRLLHVASLVPVKDQTTLLRAFAGVVRYFSGAHLHIIGTGPLRYELEVLASSLDIVEHLTFHEGVSHDRLPDYYRSADLFVLSSQYESQGMVVLEAAACGLPTVSTAVGVVPDLGAAARTVPVGDEEALTKVLLNLLTHPAARDEMASKGLALVRERFALTYTVRMLEGLYDELATSGRARHALFKPNSTS